MCGYNYRLYLNLESYDWKTWAMHCEFVLQLWRKYRHASPRYASLKQRVNFMFSFHREERWLLKKWILHLWRQVWYIIWNLSLVNSKYYCWDTTVCSKPHNFMAKISCVTCFYTTQVVFTFWRVKWCVWPC